MSGIIASYLRPIQAYLDEPEVREICINRPGEIWIERSGTRGMQRVALEEYDFDRLCSMIRCMGSTVDKVVNEKTPLLSCSLDGGLRVQAVLPPNVDQETIALSIRRPIAVRMLYQDWQYAFDHYKNKPDVQRGSDLLKALYAARDLQGFIREAILLRKNILISGPCSSGKTTFMNACLDLFPAYERLASIEVDARELIIQQPNHVCLVGWDERQSCSDATVLDLLAAILRLRPDRLLMGELRGAEAFAYLRCIATGHPGSICTLHAGSPQEALEQLVFMVMQAKLGLSSDYIHYFVQSVVHIVLQIDKDANGIPVFQDVLWLEHATA